MVATMTLKKKLAWIITFILPATILLVPSNDRFTYNVKLFFMITMIAILWFAFELTNNFIPALFLPVAYILSGITNAESAFLPWTSPIPWMVLASLLIVVIVERIGLLERSAYFVLSKLAVSYKSLLYGLVVIGMLFNLVFSGITYVLLIPVVYGICKTLNLIGTKMGAGIMLAGMCAANMPSMIVYNPGMIGLAESIVKAPFDVSIGWLQCLLQNIVLFPFVFLMVFLVTKFYKPDVEFQGKDYFVKKYQSLGKITNDEKKGLILLLVFLTGLMTSGIHGISIGWVAIIVAVTFFFPGINLGTDKDIGKINFQIVVFMVSCMSIGQVSSNLKIGSLIADSVMPVMASVPVPVFIMLSWFLAVVLNIMMTPLAAIATFSLPLTQIATNYGIDPVPVLYTFMQGLDQVFLPYEYLSYLFAFSFGVITTNQFLKFFSLKTVLNFIYMLAVVIPYWKIIGLV